MLSMSSEQRKKEEKARSVRNKGWIPGVLYGPKTKAASLKVSQKEFEKVYEEAGESSLVQLKSKDGEAPVLIREIQRDPMKGGIIHVDFYQPPLDEKIEVQVPLVFEGEAPAVHNLGGTLLKNIQEVGVKALPQHLPHEIAVDVSKLESFEEKILIKDLTHGTNIEILRENDEIVAQVTEAEDVEAELEQAIEEDVEAVEQVQEEKKEEGEEGEEAAASVGEGEKKEQ